MTTIIKYVHIYAMYLVKLRNEAIINVDKGSLNVTFISVFE